MFARIRSLAVAAAASVALVAAAGTASAAPQPTTLTPAQVLSWIDAHPVPAASVIDGIDAANAVLKQLGITPFTPTIGACTDLTFPLAVGGAVPGPFTPLLGNLSLGGKDFNAVQKGEVLFGFAPVGIIDESSDKSGMQVAWLNVSTLQGSLGTPMSGITDTILNAIAKRAEEAGIPAGTYQPFINTVAKPALNAIPQGGVRGGLVDTGSGTVLAATYGVVHRSNATCLFFPSLGIATAQ